MERKQIGSFGWKRQPVAQATGASEMENDKKGDYNEKSQF